MVVIIPTAIFISSSVIIQGVQKVHQTILTGINVFNGFPGE